jgi:hypothetical protein
MCLNSPSPLTEVETSLWVICEENKEVGLASGNNKSKWESQSFTMPHPTFCTFHPPEAVHLSIHTDPNARVLEMELIGCEKARYM